MVRHVGTRPRLRFTGGGRGLAVHAGARLLADLADATGSTAALSVAMPLTKVRQRGHGRGRVLADATVMIDIDATLVDARSDKQGAAGTYKGGFGFHPLVAYGASPCPQRPQHDPTRPPTHPPHHHTRTQPRSRLGECPIWRGQQRSRHRPCPPLRSTATQALLDI